MGDFQAQLEVIRLVEKRLSYMRLEKSKVLLDINLPNRQEALRQMDSYINITLNQLDSLNKSLASTQLQQSEEPLVDKAEVIEEIVNTEDDCELISSYSIEAEQEEEDEFALIPSYFFEEDDDSLNFDLLIPSFLFDEEENSFYQVKFQSKEVISSTVNCEKPGCSKELFFRHSNLIGKSRFSLRFDASRSIFDRGKRIPNSFNSNEKLIVPRISSLGYQLDFSDFRLIVRLCITDATFQVEIKLFAKMSEFVHLNDVGVEFFWQLKMHKVFDRGKESHLIPGLSCFINSSRDNFDTNTSCVIVGTGFTFMDACYDNFNSKLIAELEYCFIFLYECSNVFLFVKEGDSHDINQLFEQRPQQCHTPWSFVLLQVPRQRESGTFFCASVILVWVPTGAYSVTSRPVTNLSSRNTWFAQMLGRKGE